MTEIYRQYQNICRNGWEIKGTSNYVETDASESLRHRVAKQIAAAVAQDAGYQTASECTVQETGRQCDVLAWGHESRRPIVIELEQDAKDDVVKSKLDHYCVGPVREVFVIRLDRAPAEVGDLYNYIAKQTGLIHAEGVEQLANGVDQE